MSKEKNIIENHWDGYSKKGWEIISGLLVAWLAVILSIDALVEADYIFPDFAGVRILYLVGSLLGCSFYLILPVIFQKIGFIQYEKRTERWLPKNDYVVAVILSLAGLYVFCELPGDILDSNGGIYVHHLHGVYMMGSLFSFTWAFWGIEAVYQKKMMAEKNETGG